MIKTVRFVVALALVLVSGAAKAGEVGDYAKGAGVKLAHGLASVLYAPFDQIVTPIAFAIDQDQQGPVRSVVGFVAGIPLGMLNANLRSLRGGAELATFLFVADPSAARPFELRPQLTGYAMLAAPEKQRPVQVASRSSRPSGD